MPATSRLRTEGRAGAAAVTFLTRVPVLPRAELSGLDVARGALYFPCIGALIGGAVGGSAILLARELPPLAAGGAALCLGAILTGAMHLDALADTADALGGKDRAHALEIMRDHRVGAYGAIALVLGLTIKASVIAELAVHEQMAAFVVAGALSRATAPALALVLPYARAANGTGRSLTEQTSTQRVLLGLLVAGTLALATDEWPLVVGVGLTAALLGLYVRRWLGGVTGDTLGATVEISETVALVVAVALL